MRDASLRDAAPAAVTQESRSTSGQGLTDSRAIAHVAADPARSGVRAEGSEAGSPPGPGARPAPRSTRYRWLDRRPPAAGLTEPDDRRAAREAAVVRPPRVSEERDPVRGTRVVRVLEVRSHYEYHYEYVYGADDR